MTTPGGVPNLPTGALTLDTAQSKLQDTTAAAQRARAAERVPAVFAGSNGGSPTSDLSPFGIITQLFAGFNATVANADPADIQGPEDLPGLLHDFIESLPVVGTFVALGDAIGGTYDGDDPVLLGIQELFRPLRELLAQVAGAIASFPPSPEEIEAGWTDFVGRVQDAWNRAGEALTNLIMPHRIPTVSLAAVSDKAQNLLTNPDISDSGALDGSTDWAWDGSQDHTGKAGSGSVKSLGFGKYLLSNEIDVNANETLSISAWVKYSGITAVASQHGIRVSVVAYSAAGAVVSTTRVASVASPTGTVSWTQITGTYTVPSSGVESIRIQLGVTADVSAGTVWFDDLDAHKTGINSTTINGINSTATTTSTSLSSLLANLLANPGVVIGSLVHNVIDSASNTFQNFLDGLWAGLSGGSATGKTAGHVSTAAAGVKSLSDTASTNASTAIANTETMAAGAWDGWYTTGGTGAPSELQSVVAAIKTTIAGGWTVQTLTTSGSWTRPAPVSDILDFWVICIGSGSGGGKGQSAGTSAGKGGPGGGYVAQQINPADIPSTVSYTVAAGGAGATSSPTAAPNNGGVSSFGSLASSAGTVGASIGSLFGYYDASNSAPGAGGDGGAASTSPASDGAAGGSTPLAAGGAGGAGVTGGAGGAGSAGASASLTGQTRAGGAGGGGGGGTRGAGAAAGAGGNGGFPGGGGGGGGAGNNAGAIGGNGGAGANSVIILIYRLRA